MHLKIQNYHFVIFVILIKLVQIVYYFVWYFQYLNLDKYLTTKSRYKYYYGGNVYHAHEYLFGNNLFFLIIYN